MTFERIPAALAVLLFLVIGDPAFAATVRPDWRLVATDATNVVYVDAASIEKSGDAVSYDLMTVHHSFATTGDRQPLYIVDRAHNRCSAQAHRATRKTVFDTRGLAIFTSVGPDAPWFAVTPKGHAEAAFDFVCLNRLSLDQSATRGKTALQLATADAARLATASAAWLASERTRTTQPPKN